MTTLNCAISPCPNDTFIFGGLILGLVDSSPFDLTFAFEDIQTLNEATGRFDVIKLSAARALDLPEHVILSAGSAFGLSGNGPKLVARPDAALPPRRIAVPGLDTTAYQLLRLARGDTFTPVPTRYDQIIPAVLSGRVDAGLLIHESALAYASHGLALVLDLGEWWAGHTNNLPLPLGVIAARKSLGATAITRLEELIRHSLTLARTDPRPIWPLIKSLAQEMDDSTITAHIEAYVNDLSLDMGGPGRAALARLGGAGA